MCRKFEKEKVDLKGPSKQSEIFLSAPLNYVAVVNLYLGGQGTEVRSKALKF
jgi:hypothetical protein